MNFDLRDDGDVLVALVLEILPGAVHVVRDGLAQAAGVAVSHRGGAAERALE